MVSIGIDLHNQSDSSREAEEIEQPKWQNRRQLPYCAG